MQVSMSKIHHTGTLSSAQLSNEETTVNNHNKPRPAPHCTVLPPGKFDGIIGQPLSVNSISFTTISETVFS